MKIVNATLAFRKVTPTSTLTAKAIGKWTKSPFYHVELIVNDTWVSVYGGVGVKLNKLRPLKGEWVYRPLGDIELTDEQYDIFMEFLQAQEGKAYDYTGIYLSQVIPLKIHSEQKWFCSELVCKLLQLLYVRAVINLFPVKESPGSLGRIFTSYK